jgi:hypothetical protein
MKEESKKMLNRFNGDKFSTLVALDLIIESWKENGNKRLDSQIIDYYKKLRTYIISL